MQNVKQTFEALETIATATNTTQEIYFSYCGEKFSFQVDSTTKGLKLTNVRRWSSRVTNYITDAMNVEKITNKYLCLYTYSMLDNRINEKMDISKIELINPNK